MPSRNRVKQYSEDAYYHVYNRGVNRQRIFKDDEDYAVFLNLLKRYLSDKPVKDKKGREYDWLYPELELLSYCLMPNHFHILLFQVKKDSMTKLLRGVATAYTVYFNKKYKRIGPLFQGVFKASLINRDDYLQHITRYIHMNPDNYEEWQHSSLAYYLGSKNASWVRPEKITGMFEDHSYRAFLSDYKGYRQSLKELKSELADNLSSFQGPTLETEEE